MISILIAIISENLYFHKINFLLNSMQIVKDFFDFHSLSFINDPTNVLISGQRYFLFNSLNKE